MNLSILDINGNEVEATEMPQWLEQEKGGQAVHDAVVAYLANQRSGNAATKTRAMVRGGGAKPFRQKGTGRARAGSNRSPIWRGGGITFGPQPRSYSKSLNKKVKRLALNRALTERFNSEDVILVDQVTLEAPKTKALVQVLKALNAGENTLIIVDHANENLLLAARNLPKVEVATATNVNTYSMLLHKKVVLTNAALTQLGQRINKGDDA